jgi:chitodextrinase
LRAVALAAALLPLGSAVSAAGPDRKAPTAPTNLTVTGTTAYSVSLAWGASTDNSGSFTYRIVNRTWGTSVDAPGTQTTATFALNLKPQQTYSFQVYAVDDANNWSKPSNTVSATLPKDTTAPQAPHVILTDSGPTHLTLGWTTQDDDPRPIYLVFMNGLVLRSGSADASIVVAPLAPETSYTFAVQARDSSGNWSPVSAPLTATTDASDASDTTPPTTPALNGYVLDGACEVQLDFASSDDVTPAQFIRYDIYLNGAWLDSTSLGYTHVIEYGNVDGPNTFEVVAVDEAGNASAPAAVTLDLIGCIGTP